MFELISAMVVIVFFLFVYDRLTRISNAVEVAAQYQESMDRKLCALVEQLVELEKKKAVYDNYDSKSGYSHARIG